MLRGLPDLRFHLRFHGRDIELETFVPKNRPRLLLTLSTNARDLLRLRHTNLYLFLVRTPWPFVRFSVLRWFLLQS